MDTSIGETIPTYTSAVKSQDQALSHLFFHCCLEDEQFTDTEMNDLSAKVVTLGLAARVNIKEELIRYRSYRLEIPDERLYIRYLLDLIRPVNELALYSWCVELCIDDPSLDPREEALLRKIALELELDVTTADTITRLMAQRRAVEIGKIF